MVNKIRILLVDDHAIVRKGLHTLISNEADMEVIGEAANGIEAVEQARVLTPDVIVLDLVMPGQDGIETMKQLFAQKSDIRILVLTSFSDQGMVLPTIRAGVLGYLLKDSQPEQLLQAIRTVSLGQSILHPLIARQVMEEVNRPVEEDDELLTVREVAVLKLVARGFSNLDIAESLAINERTVGNHISNILSKLHSSNRTQAALYALRQGMATLDEP